MTLDEAYAEAVFGSCLTAAHLPAGVHLSYAFKGFRREWPNGDGCTFIATPEDEAADWYEVERAAPPEPVAPNVGFVPGRGVAPSPAPKKDAWGRPIG